MSPPDGTNATTTTTDTTTQGTQTQATDKVETGTTQQTTDAAGTQQTTQGTTQATTATTTDAPKWADDWRKTMAKGDDAGVKRLERYKDPEAVYDALVNAQKKIDSGQIKTKLPDNPTPEQIAEYRKENNIPEAADKYDTTVGEGHVWGEADKPILDGFLKHMHDQNATPGEVKKALSWYAGLAKAKAAEQVEQDAAFRHESTAKLGEKYGGDFKRNIAHVDSFLEEFPPGIKEKVLGARLPNGRLAGSDPEFIDFLYQQALFKNPIATVMGGNSDAAIKTAEARRDELVKMSGDDDSPYNKGPTAERNKLRAELLKLNEDLAAVKARR